MPLRTMHIMQWPVEPRLSLILLANNADACRDNAFVTGITEGRGFTNAYYAMAYRTSTFFDSYI